MHCDLRDDPPSSSDTTKPRNGEYFSNSLHGKIEWLWDDAIMPVALEEKIIKTSYLKNLLLILRRKMIVKI